MGAENRDSAQSMRFDNSQTWVGGDGGGIFARFARAIGNSDPLGGTSPNGGDARMGKSLIERGQRRASWPMHELFRREPPEPARQFLAAADNALLIVVGRHIDHAQDLQHRTGKIRIPASGAEADLAEDLAILERAAEGRRAGDEAIERAFVPDRHQGIPDRLDARHVARANGLLHGGETRLALQRLGPSARHPLELLGQVFHLAGVPGLVLEFDHRARRGGRKRVWKRPRREADQSYIVVETGGRGWKAHGAQFGDAFGMIDKGLRAQPPADLGGFIDDGLEAELHQLIGGDQTRDAGADHRHLATVAGRRQMTKTCGMADPVVIGEGKIRNEHGDRWSRGSTWLRRRDRYGGGHDRCLGLSKLASSRPERILPVSRQGCHYRMKPQDREAIG